MKKWIRIAISLVGCGIGAGICLGIVSLLMAMGVNFNGFFAQWWIPVLVYLVASLFFGLLFYLIEPSLVLRFRRLIAFVDGQISKLDTKDILLSTVGLIAGLLIAFLLTNLVNLIPFPPVAITLSVLLYIFLGYLGVDVALKRKGDEQAQALMEGLTRQTSHSTQQRSTLSRAERSIPPKVLDTSVIIDGRIYDVMKTGIIEGRVLIPEFVLQELRHIADSADSLRRQKGRRGLDILARMQREFPNVSVTDKDYEDMEVDEKLMRLAMEMKGKVITNDLNLNKVATVKEVGVININQLAAALKPPVLPGEVMQVRVIERGKEHGQGLAYMEDGTMIVIDNAADSVGKSMTVSVTSVLQTAAGRMVFARKSA